VIRAVVAGAAGKMGSRILAALEEEKDFKVAGAFERAGSELIGREVLGVPIAPGIEQALENGADVVIDFTAPAASLHHAAVCADRGIALVVGTTGSTASNGARGASEATLPARERGRERAVPKVADAACALGDVRDRDLRCTTG
jgi:4-hydroxy-tetrahydrodipicolinate reductase